MGFECTLPSHIIVILFCLSMLDNDDDMAEIELIYDEFDLRGQVPLHDHGTFSRCHDS